MSSSYSIYSRRCWVEGLLQPACISISGGQISGIQENIVEGAIDYGESVIMPGVIDAHVHINEPGRSDWEGFDTGTKAAAAGGITTIVDMPLNSSPVTTTVAALREKMSATIGNMHVNVGFYGGLVPANVNELEALAGAGVLGIKCFLTHSGIDEFPNIPTGLLKEALLKIRGYALPLLVHCELSKDLKNAQDQPATYWDFMESRPDVWETTAVEKVIEAARVTGSKVHIVHVSSSESLPLIETARDSGVQVSAETCPHYIFFAAEEIPSGDPLYKCAPPIRSRHNNERLISGLKNGVLDFLASDHSPAPPGLKELESGDFLKAWGGIAGLQFLLNASFTSLRDFLNLEQFIPLLTEKPAAFLQLETRKGWLRKGYDADICIWNPEKFHIITEDEIYHRHKSSPYAGRKLFGEIVSTIVNGELVFSNNLINSLNAGTWVLKK